MRKQFIVWDGKHLPRRLAQVPPGKYELRNVDDPEDLSPAQERGIRAALRQLDAGKGKSLAQVIAEIRARGRRR